MQTLNAWTQRHKQTNPHQPGTTNHRHTISQAPISSLFGQCRSVCEDPKHNWDREGGIEERGGAGVKTRMREGGGGKKNNPKRINQMFWFVTDALLSLCLVATWVLCRCAKQSCLLLLFLPPLLPLTFPMMSVYIFPVCVHVWGKSLACLNVCVCSWVCVCVCVEWVFLLLRCY